MTLNFIYLQGRLVREDPKTQADSVSLVRGPYSIHMGHTCCVWGELHLQKNASTGMKLLYLNKQVQHKLLYPEAQNRSICERHKAGVYHSQLTSDIYMILEHKGHHSEHNQLRNDQGEVHQK